MKCRKMKCRKCNYELNKDYLGEENKRKSMCTTCILKEESFYVLTTEDILKSEEAREYFDIQQDLECSETPKEENIDYNRLCTWRITNNKNWVHYRYKEAFNLLMEYWNCLPDEDKPKIDKKLRELGV